MIAVSLALLSGVFFGALVVAIRRGLRREADPELGPLGLVPVALVLVVATAALVSPWRSQAPGGRLWPYVVAGALVPGVSHLIFVRAIRDTGPARAAVVVGMAPLLSSLLAVLVLGEPLRAGLVVGATLIVSSGVALAGERVRPVDFRTVGLVLGLVVALFFAARDLLVRWAGAGHVPALAATATNLAAAALVVTAYHLLTRSPRELGPNVQRALVAYWPAGVFFALAYSCLLIAIDHGRVSIVSPLTGTQSLWAVGFAAVYIGKSEAIGRRLVLAAVLTAAGVVIIGATR